jgi:hypothetical protein
VTPKQVFVPVPLRVGLADFGAFWPVGGFPAPFRLFQPNLTRGGSLIYHPDRWDEAKSVPWTLTQPAHLKSKLFLL